ncbi:MAG: CCA tRNA nucleotidyltransferase [Pseudomonadota bacterium]
MRGFKIPKPVVDVVRGLRRRGFEAYIVGGAVRDLKSGQEPKDWDIATNARPEAVEHAFRRTIPTGKKYGTITVLSKGFPVQVTTYRTEGKYVGRRKPARVSFVSSLTTDLSRRDFTINAMALDPISKRILDPFGGAADLSKRRLRTVGRAQERLSEDALRAIRAGRFISQMGLTPSPGLSLAAKKTSPHVRALSKERIKDELKKLLLGPHAGDGLRWLDRVGILKLILPELMRGKGVKQGGWHRHDVFRHQIRCIDLCPAQLDLRLALLLHDVAKPITRTKDARGYHFYGHERRGAEIAARVLRRLRFPAALIEEVRELIRHHLFEADQIAPSDAAVRRLMNRVGDQRIDRLILMRKVDVKGCGADRKPGRELDLLARKIAKIRKARQAITLKNLAVDGNDVMKWLKIPPGPNVGWILRALLEEILRHPKKNDRAVLRTKALKLASRLS